MTNLRFAGEISRLLVYAPPCANACVVFRGCAPPSPSAGLCSAPADFASLRVLGAPAASRPLAAHCASLRVLATSALRASDGQRSGRECIFTFRTDPQFSMVVPLRSQARLWLSLLHWAYYGLFPPLAAAFVRPCASLARCSVPAHFVCSALQPFGPSPFCKHLHPQFAIVDLHRSQARLQLSLLTGLTSACFAHCARPSCASSIQHGRSAALTSSLAALPASLGLLRPVSRTARGLRAPRHF